MQSFCMTEAPRQTDEYQTVEYRGGGFAPKPVRWIGPAVFIVLIALAEVGTRAGIISALTLPRPSQVLATFGELYQSGLLWKHLWPSLSRLAVGALIGASSGIVIGVLIGLFSYVRSGLVPLVAAIFPIPKIALLPLFVIWFGIDEGSKYALIAFGTFTPTVVATFGAVDNVDRTLIRMGQSFGLSWLSIVPQDCVAGRDAWHLVRSADQPVDRNHSACRSRDAWSRVRRWRLYSAGRFGLQSRATVRRSRNAILPWRTRKRSNHSCRTAYSGLAIMKQ